MSHFRLPLARISAIGGMFVVLFTAAIVITAVATQNTSVKATPAPLRSVAILSPRKQTVEAAGVIKAAAYGTAHPGVVTMVPPQTPSPLPVGIQNKYPSWWNVKQPLQNEWYGYINGERLSAFAGNVATIYEDGRVIPDPLQGYIAVAVGLDLSGPSRNYHEYLTPTKHGATSITAVNGSVVSLTAQDGTTFTFDLGTRTFS